MEKRIPLTLDDANLQLAQDFFRIYEIEDQIYTHHLDSVEYLGDKKNQVCRFCGKTSPEVLFKNDAHVFPQFLGNRHLLSNFECDTCNKQFGSLYEDSLACYLSPYRPFSFIESSKNNKHPKHKETKNHNGEKKVRLSIQQKDKKEVELIYYHPFEDAFNIDIENKTFEINAFRKPYTPIYLYKMLLKIGLSIINVEEIMDFDKTRNFLRDNTQNEKFKNFGLLTVHIKKIYGLTMFKTPSVVLYKKKKGIEYESFISKTIIIYSANHIFQIFIPFNKKDDGLYGKTTTLFPYPLLLDKMYYEQGITYDSLNILMDGNEKIRNEEQKIELCYDDIVHID